MGFNAKKAAKSVNSAASGLEEQAKTRTAANRDKADDDLSSVRKSMSGNTASRTTKKADAPARKQSFAEAFRAARREKGAGSTFTWNGKSYSTNMAGEGAGKKPASSAPAKPAADKPSAPSSSKPATSSGSMLKDKPEYRAARTGSGPGVLSRIGSAVSSEVDRSRAMSARARQEDMARRAAMRAAPTKDEWVAGASPSGGRLLRGYAKGGSIDGAAIRGKTRLKRNK